ncbi:hypothetical protein QYF36_022865 [Acer negundo]|nr:hypothetical protein QYF36_022865 [Acer negundo]
MAGSRVAHATLKGPSVVKELCIGLVAGDLWKMQHWNEQRKVRTFYDLLEKGEISVVAEENAAGYAIRIASEAIGGNKQAPNAALLPDRVRAPPPPTHISAIVNGVLPANDFVGKSSAEEARSPDSFKKLCYGYRQRIRS